MSNTSVQTKKEILVIIKENQDKIKRLGVKRIGLFGSFVRGEQDEESDIDFLVEFKQDQKTFDNFIQLSFLLENLLKRRVELVTIESLSPYIRPYIIKEIVYASLTSRIS